MAECEKPGKKSAAFRQLTGLQTAKRRLVEFRAGEGDDPLLNLLA